MKRREFGQKLVGSAFEGQPGFKLAYTRATFQFKIPIFRDIFRVREALFLRAGTTILTREEA